MLYIIVYDIPGDRRRARLAKVLEGFGQRVQGSVFECDLTDRQYAVLRRRLAKIVRADEGDSLRTYRLCANCAATVDVIGNGPPVATSIDTYII
ncbi:MAG: CRISPR-associated endonuclease Cas2 [Chloroflexota bacterium]|nr:MAG: CRISPR-associated endonuclease Cas2 [Chloroflexota bacterium]